MILYHDILPERFSEHLDYLEKEYNITHLDVLRDHYLKGTPLPQNSLFITFDDGWKSNYDLLSILQKKKGMPITIFLSTGLIGSNRKPAPRSMYDNFDANDCVYEISVNGKIMKEIVLPLPEMPERTMLNIDEIKEMSKIVNFQSHLVNHHVSTVIPDELLRDEMTRSKETIESITGKQVYAMAYPYNSVDERETQFAKESGYVMARSGGRVVNDAITDRYMLNCIGISSNWSVKQLRDALLRAEVKTVLRER